MKLLAVEACARTYVLDGSIDKRNPIPVITTAINPHFITFLKLSTPY